MLKTISMKAADIRKLMGENLARLRKEKRLTQERLAEMIETNAGHISQMEKGRGIGPDVLAKLCNALKAKPLEFFLPSPTTVVSTEMIRVCEPAVEWKGYSKAEGEYIKKLISTLRSRDKQAIRTVKHVIDLSAKSQKR